MNQIGKLSRATFTYTIDKKQKAILIVDTGHGRTLTVTNDIENVVHDIAQCENVDAREFSILYRDSFGSIDAWDAKAENFILLSGDSTEFKAAFEELKSLTK